MDIKEFCDLNALTIREFALKKWMGVQQKTIWSWQNGITMPRKSHIKKLLDISNGKITYEDILKTYQMRQKYEKRIKGTEKNPQGHERIQDRRSPLGVKKRAKS